MSRYTQIGTNTQNAYGWVTAKNDPDAYFAKKNDDYKASTGKSRDSSWNGWNNQGQAFTSSFNSTQKDIVDKVDNNSYAFGQRLPNNAKGTTLDLSKSRTDKANQLNYNGGEWGYKTRQLDNIDPKAQVRSRPLNYDGTVTEKTMDLGNPNNYLNPELQRYFDGPNANMNYMMDGKYIKLSGNNSSKELGGEDLVNTVAKYYKNKNSGLASGYGNFVGKQGNQYTFNKDGVDKNLFYTPYDRAISGDSQGRIANQDLNYWNDKAFYDNGFLSEQDPGNRQLGTETTTIGYTKPKKPGFLSSLGSLLPKLALNLIPGGQYVSAAMTAGNLLSPDKPGRNNVFQGNFLEGAPQFDFGNGNVPSSNGNTSGTPPNIQNPGTGGSQQTSQTMNKFNYNNVDYNVSGNNLYAPSGNLAYNKGNDTGSTGLGASYNTYLGTL